MSHKVMSQPRSKQWSVTVAVSTTGGLGFDLRVGKQLSQMCFHSDEAHQAPKMAVYETAHALRILWDFLFSLIVMNQRFRVPPFFGSCWILLIVTYIYRTHFEKMTFMEVLPCYPAVAFRLVSMHVYKAPVHPHTTNVFRTTRQLINNAHDNFSFSFTNRGGPFFTDRLYRNNASILQTFVEGTFINAPIPNLPNTTGVVFTVSAPFKRPTLVIAFRTSALQQVKLWCFSFWTMTFPTISLQVTDVYFLRFVFSFISIALHHSLTKADAQSTENIIIIFSTFHRHFPYWQSQTCFWNYPYISTLPVPPFSC